MVALPILPRAKSTGKTTTSAPESSSWGSSTLSEFLDPRRGVPFEDPPMCWGLATSQPQGVRREGSGHRNSLSASADSRSCQGGQAVLNISTFLADSKEAMEGVIPFAARLVHRVAVAFVSRNRDIRGIRIFPGVPGGKDWRFKTMRCCWVTWRRSVEV
jgi:hypothetical protein